ncbi:MAG: ankyrin repeat domain-containing protein [Lysobacteraceae bacterium]
MADDPNVAGGHDTAAEAVVERPEGTVTAVPPQGDARAGSQADLRAGNLIAVLFGMGAAAALPLLSAWGSALGWCLLQALFAWTALALCGQRLSFARADVRASTVRFLAVFLLSLAALLLLAAWPTQSLLATGGLGWALLLGLTLAVAWLLLWPRWPLLLAAWLPAIRTLAPAGRLRLAGLARSLADWQPGDPVPPRAELPMRGLGYAALLLVLLASGPLLWRFSSQPLAWAGGALLVQLVYVALFAAGLRAREALLSAPTPGLVTAAAPAAAESQASLFAGDPTMDLREALRQARVEEALVLIQAGDAASNAPLPGQVDQRSPLMLAALLSDLRPLRELIAAGADVNANHGDLSALLVATRDSYHGRVEAVMTLLANGADPRAADAEGNTPLHHAARSSDPGVAALLLDAGAEIDAPNRGGLTPLGVACSCSNWRLARFLLENKASAKGDDVHPPLLAAAAGDDDPAGVRLLLKHRAGVNASGRFGRTALHTAALSGNNEVVAALIEAGADVDVRDERGIAPLHEAARAGADAVIERLIQAGADPAVVDEAGCNALNIACRSRRGTVATLRALLRMGVDRGHVGSDGKTPLEQVLASGRWALVATLDPSYQLPASVVLDDDIADDVLPLPERLLRFLGEGRFDDAQSALDHEALDAGAMLALALALAAREDGIRGLCWLYQRGLIDDGRLDSDADGLLFRLLDAGQTMASPLLALLQRGASVSGAGGLARYLRATLDAEQASRACESMALLLLDHGIDPFAPNADGEATLILALRQGWLRLFERLLLIGCDPEQRDRAGNTALQLACSIGLEPAVRLLVRHGANAAARSADGQTAQGMALSAGRRDLSRWMSWQQWQPPRRPLQPADLCAAAAIGDRAAVERLLELGLPINAVDAQGCSALLRAAGGGRLVVVDLLLQRGADPALPALSGATPLSAAVSMGHREVVATLLAAGARVEQSLPGSVTPLMVASALGQGPLIDPLIGAGADINRTDDAGNTALLAAAQYLAAHGGGAVAAELLQRLLSAGADADAANHAGQTTLLLLLGARLDAGARIDEETVLAGLDKLLARGVDLSAQERRGYGPLHLAALHGLSRVVTRLLSAGARPALRDTLGRSAHDIAVMRGFVDIAQLFEPRAQPSLARYLKPGSGQVD